MRESTSIELTTIYAHSKPLKYVYLAGRVYHIVS